jgi:hypothetical protein
MRNEPPFMSDEEADRVWRRGVETSMGSRQKTIDELQAQVDRLQQEIAQRQHIERATGPRQATPPLLERIFRQGSRTNTAEDLPRMPWDQPELRPQVFFNADQPEVGETFFKTSKVVVKGKKRLESQNRDCAHQSSPTENPSFTRPSPPEQNSGRKNVAKSQDSGKSAHQHDGEKISLKRKQPNDFAGGTF